MEVSYMILCQYAEASPEGKIVIIGGDLDTFIVPNALPAFSGLPLYLVVRTAFPANECGAGHDYQVQFLTPDGTALATMLNRVETPMPAPGRQTKTVLVVTFGGVAFPVLGEYAMTVSIDGIERKRTPVYVTQG